MAEVHAVMPQAIQKSGLDAFGAKTPGFAGSVKRVKATKLHAKLVPVTPYFISDAVDHLPEDTSYFVVTLADGREPAAKRPRLLAGRVAADGRRDNRNRVTYFALASARHHLARCAVHTRCCSSKGTWSPTRAVPRRAARRVVRPPPPATAATTATQRRCGSPARQL